MSGPPVTADHAPVNAHSAGLCMCAACQQVCRITDPALPPRCPRCGARLHARKPDSLTRTWAYLIAALILYIPANLLPIMHTESLLGSSDDTIISGVVYFWVSGSAGLATLIFTVSIVVPLAKMGILAYLTCRVRWPGRADRHQLGRLYRLVELVGRWSMLDVFVVALMVGMVQFQSLASIKAGAGAVAFGAVVVLSMLAANSFDPRLLWDNNGSPDDDR